MKKGPLKFTVLDRLLFPSHGTIRFCDKQWSFFTIKALELREAHLFLTESQKHIFESVEINKTI